MTTCYAYVLGLVDQAYKDKRLPNWNRQFEIAAPQHMLSALLDELAPSEPRWADLAVLGERAKPIVESYFQSWQHWFESKARALAEDFEGTLLFGFPLKRDDALDQFTFREAEKNASAKEG